MQKESFLRDEYDRIISSGGYVWSGWRDSFLRFQADLWDMTPSSGRSGRFLAAIDPALGLTPDNVEWHFPKARPHKPAREVKNAPVKKAMLAKPTPLAWAQKRAEEKQRVQAEKQARREALATEFMRWEKKRAG